MQLEATCLSRWERKRERERERERVERERERERVKLTFGVSWSIALILTCWGISFVQVSSWRLWISAGRIPAQCQASPGEPSFVFALLKCVGFTCTINTRAWAFISWEKLRQYKTRAAGEGFMPRLFPADKREGEGFVVLMIYSRT